MLASGLPDLVGDDEELARFLPSKSQFNAQMVKPAAFLPSANDHQTSVFRYGSEPRAALWALGDEHAAGNRTIHGAAIVAARDVRAALLDVLADEPPPRHAVISGWPWLDDDRDLQKAQQKERAAEVASKAVLLRR
jgi:hypothetical protein